MPPASKVLIIGGGVIGLSLAWQLRGREIAVTVMDPFPQTTAPPPSFQASQAAAGMLAVEDPHNPPELLSFSRYSRSLYDDFLADIQEISGQPVPFQTHNTLQTLPDGRVVQLAEQSLDPRQLVSALRGTAERLGVRRVEQDFDGALPRRGSASYNACNMPKDENFDAVVYTRGAWSAAGSRQGAWPGLPVAPRKGQMLRVATPPGLHLREVHRAEHVYVVPRLLGPQAGSALLGATVEDAGFDAALSPSALRALREAAAQLVPALADERQTPAVESWAGFRPSTPDALPLLGELTPPEHPHSTPAPLQAERHFIATGHYRNGILLAPGTAMLLADLIQGKTPLVPLGRFRPERFLQPVA